MGPSFHARTIHQVCCKLEAESQQSNPIHKVFNFRQHFVCESKYFQKCHSSHCHDDVQFQNVILFDRPGFLPFLIHLLHKVRHIGADICPGVQERLDLIVNGLLPDCG